VIKKRDRTIASFEDWAEWGRPKRDGHWKDGRSAMEAARCWAGSLTMPSEVLAILADHPDFGEITQWSGEPEASVKFDSFRGPPNIDLLLCPEDERGAFIVAVEAKADEPFGRTVATYRRDAAKAKAASPNSRQLERIEQLVPALFGDSSAGLPAVEALRYQLLTATAGALAEATRRGIDRAVLLVQEFRTSLTTAKRQAVNHADLTAFVSQISGGAVSTVEEGRLYGPFRVPEGAFFKAPAGLYVGKVGREVV
jgi:hypothetical protein